MRILVLAYVFLTEFKGPVTSNDIQPQSPENHNFIDFRRATLGASCLSNKECKKVPGALCIGHTCRCGPLHVQLGTRKCLPGTLLGYPCTVSSQCDLRVEHSGCVQGYCRCSYGYIAYRRSNCLKGARVGEVCRSDEQCQFLDPESHCRFLVPKVYGLCLGTACTASRQCSDTVPGSICRWSPDKRQPTICTCPLGYVESLDKKRCIPVQKDLGFGPKSLGQQCSADADCSAADPHSTCILGRCDCVRPTRFCSATNTGCYKDTFQCESDGRCISWFFLCDGKRDCPDGSDEDSCKPHRCPDLAFTCGDGSCISRGRLCDGKRNCPDGADEQNCTATTSSKCPDSTFQCSDGECLPGFAFCNATPTCADASDEVDEACIQGSLTVDYCPFRCNNGRCRSTAVLCSGTNGCGDNSDEEKCSVCSCVPVS